MCVPCAAALPEIWPFLLALIGVPLVIAAMAVISLGKGLSYLAPAARMLVSGVYRFVSGAVLGKPDGMSDVEYWDIPEAGTPRFTRPVRATLRLVPTAVIVGLFVSPLVVAIVTGTLIVAAAGTAVYGKRYEIRRALGAPVKARIEIRG